MRRRWPARDTPGRSSGYPAHRQTQDNRNRLLLPVWAARLRDDLEGHQPWFRVEVRHCFRPASMTDHPWSCPYIPSLFVMRQIRDIVRSVRPGEITVKPRFVQCATREGNLREYVAVHGTD